MMGSSSKSMTDYSSIEITMERPRKSPTWTVLLSDFANMLKAFMGSNYLTIAYAFTQSGLVPGIVLLVIIASITNHCCHMIVKCKYAAIGHITDKHRAITDLDRDGNESESSTETPEEEIPEELAAMRQKMVRNMTYGDVGRIAFGGPGLLIVNICLMFTQFGFCVGYFIFLGNTMYHLFPYKNTTLEYDVVNASIISQSSSSNFSSWDSMETASSLSHSSHGSSSSFSSTMLSNLVKRSAGDSMVNVTGDEIMDNLTSTVSTFLSELVSNSTLTSLNVPSNTTTTLATPTNSITSTLFTTTTTATTVNTTTTIPSTTSHDITTALPDSKLLHYIGISEAPDLRLLVITPLPIFVGFAFLRDIRHLGFVSVAADVAIFAGCIVTMVVLSVGFSTSDSWTMYEWIKIPVFFGMVTSSFEGIGTIIPIESSMEGNRHNFGRFLHGAVVIMTLILLSFGVLGYLRYGDETAQMINKNMPDGSVGVMINVCLCIGVVLTFPLQIYPVIELSEIYLFGNDRICGPNTRKHRRLSEAVNTQHDDSDDDYSDEEEDKDSLLASTKSTAGGDSGHVAMTVSDEVSTWKRNALRIVLVIVAGGMAVLLRDLYAYVSAFIGAVGSSVLAYILPCMFHLKLCWATSSRGVLGKDMAIIVFGVVASLFSLYSTVNEVIERRSLI